MIRPAQAISLALVFALNLVPNRVDAATRVEHDGRAAVRLDAGPWLHGLRDQSIEIERRLELTVSDPDFVRWLGQSLSELHLMVPAQAIEEIQADPRGDTDCFKFIIEGLQSLEDAMSVLPTGDSAAHVLDDFQVEPPMIDEVMAQLTNPEFPEIIGDELQSFAEGFVALLGTALLEEQDPDLALEFAKIFAQRSSRVARLIVLLVVWQGSESELSVDANSYVSDADREKLTSDRARAERHVANLQKLAGRGKPLRS